ncbi:MAG: hypothetical protein EOO39_46660 [Cytophagaceae bacterium]|nr:MAG: hypothetical protein EOO39_46660 [Cytophagaceae bacterium]
MAIRPRSGAAAAFRNALDLVARRFHAAMLLNLRMLGEACITQARTLGSYRDVTGNLRSSVGYVIVVDGQVVDANFEVTSGGALGMSAGERYARSLASQFSAGYVLIVVAGMNYAAKVESRGRDVLTSAEQYCQLELPVVLKRLRDGINRMAA